MNHLRELQQALREEGLDALLLLTESGRFYATDFQSSAGMALILPDRAFLMTDFRYIEACRERVRDCEVRLTTRENPGTAQVKAILDEHPALCIGIDEGGLTLDGNKAWKKTLPRRKLISAAALLGRLRAQKAEWEIERMQEAQRIAETAYAELLRDKVIRAGMTERALMAELVYRLFRAGADKLSFDPIVVSGPNSSKPHGVPGDRALQRGDFITLDFGCIKDGYCSDMTRTIALGEATEEMRRVYDVVLRAKEAGIAAARPGVKGCDVHNAAAAIIAQAGFGEYFGHGFGHGIGLAVHEGPSASAGNNDALPENAVISAEPGIYLPGRFGVRIEDVIVLQKGGTRNLMRAPTELTIV